MTIATPTLTGERVTLRPLTPADLDSLVDLMSEPGVREWWGTDESTPYTRESLVNGEDGVGFAVEIGGELAGWLGANEESDPNYRHGSIDIILGHRWASGPLASCASTNGGTTAGTTAC